MDICHYIAYKNISKIEKICKPLASLGIPCFTFTRHFPDERRIVLTNNSLIWEYYIESEHFDYSWSYGRPTSGFRNEIETWETNSSAFIQTENEKKLYDEIKKVFNHKCGMSFIHVTREYTDVFGFNSSNRQLYFLNHDLLKRFILYFKHNIASIFKTVSKESIYLPPSPKFNFLERLNTIQAVDEFLKQTQLNHYIIENSNKSTTLNPKDLQCIQWLIKGKTAEETAHILSVSKRTIEHRLASIKEKLNCFKTTDIVAYVYKHGIYRLFET